MAIKDYIKPVIITVLNNLPIKTPNYWGVGFADSARYCYSVWMRHLVCAKKSGLLAMPESVAEIGPGSTLGIGLAALLSGVNRYYALDVVKHVDQNKNERVFNDLLNLFLSRADIPDDKEYPHVYPKIDDYTFPKWLITDEMLQKSLNPERIELIIESIHNTNPTEVSGKSLIKYVVPWHSPQIIVSSSVDFIISQAVMEHVDDLSMAYNAMYKWLKPGGIMSHVIDFKSHGTSANWNGYWGYSDAIWKIIKGRAPYFINRCPYTCHTEYLEENGFETVLEHKVFMESGIKREDLSNRFSSLSDVDLTTSTFFFQCRKPL